GGIDRRAEAHGAAGVEPTARDLGLGVAQVDGVVAHAATAVHHGAHVVHHRRVGHVVGHPERNGIGAVAAAVVEVEVAGAARVVEAGRGRVRVLCRTGAGGCDLGGAWAGAFQVDVALHLYQGRLGVYARRHPDQIGAAG